MSLPPLPEKVSLGVGYFDEIIFGHTEAQMTEYGKACRARALAEAAELCRNERWADDNPSPVLYISAYNDACDDCVKAIGRLA